ncbi:acetyl esterase [Nocardioides alpinus]|uniref:Alpha/beta hydrolase n=2 Tax=Nocardioides TaxID=1839 RepID=A0A4Q2SMK5_9ACTN|nr:MULTISPECIES: alpha/beta hydrolase [Nocardioides]PKH38475.1 alpha/beta hydrolase [Nocardioides alpinus]RYC05380.1 alpha/beta hydrolase [Nocardioides zhouii]SFB47952.1 acetyl esterase [Nocardioides alpinus]
MTLDADMARVLEEQRARSPRADEQTTDMQGLLAQLRRQHEEGVQWMTPPAVRDRVSDVEDIGLEDEEGARVASRIYRPDAYGQGTLVWLHGGGWMTGSLETADVVARALCARAGLVVVSVDYRLAPEHPWPAAVDDARNAVNWVAKKVRSRELPGPVLVGGDSAGGNIAAVIALEPDLKDVLGGQVLVYPAVRLDAEPPGLPSRAEYKEGFGLEPNALEIAVQAYAPRAQDRTDPRVSPGLSTELAAAPPTIVVTAGCDPLRDEGNGYADALRAAGVPVQLIELPGLIHGCLDMTGQSSVADRAASEVAAALNKLVREYASPVDAPMRSRRSAP